MESLAERQKEDRDYAREIAKHGRDTAAALRDVTKEVSLIKSAQAKAEAARATSKELAWRIGLVMLSAGAAYFFAVLQKGTG